MDEKQAFQIVKEVLPLRRYEHTKRVVEEAEKLAKRFHVNVSKARLAAILHDYAKYRPIEEMRDAVLHEQELPKDLLDCSGEILHAFVGAYYVKTEQNVTEEEVLSSIRYHTTGRANMTDVEKVVFLADYIEPGRTFEGVDEVRKLANENLDLACLNALKNTISFLVEKKGFIYKDTFEAYNDFVAKTKGRV